MIHRECIPLSVDETKGPHGAGFFTGPAFDTFFGKGDTDLLLFLDEDLARAGPHTFAAAGANVMVNLGNHGPSLKI
jgi:hypothetical protein